MIEREQERIMITGGSGMVGSALRELIPNAIFLSSKDGDLREKKECERLFETYRPKYVVHLAARVGGVKVNGDCLADFYYDNIMINTNILKCCLDFGVKKTISLLSTCIYPYEKFVSYPLTEEQIHNGLSDKSNYGYSFAKRSLDVYSQVLRDQYCCNYITAVPNNLYGKYDNFDLENSHVIPAIIRKIYEAKKEKRSEVELWGSGKCLREFTYANDIARILLFLLEKYEGRFPINIGNADEILIKDLTHKITKLIEYRGEIIWNTNKPEGQFKKPSSNEKLLKLGWKKEYYTHLNEGLKEVHEWFVENYEKGSIRL